VEFHCACFRLSLGQAICIESVTSPCLQVYKYNLCTTDVKHDSERCANPLQGLAWLDGCRVYNSVQRVAKGNQGLLAHMSSGLSSSNRLVRTEGKVLLVFVCFVFASRFCEVVLPPIISA
jgi:hypothetical protein